MFTEIDKNSSIPIYRQIEADIRKKILNSELPAGFRLPSERKLAERLGVHRNTVVKAYKLLVDQSLVSCTLEQRRGYFVVFGLDEALIRKQKKNKAFIRYNHTEGTAERIFDDIYAASFQKRYISFGGHVISDQLIPLETIKRIMNRIVDQYGADAFSYCPSRGNPLLRKALASFLESNGTNVKGTEIVIVNETMQGLSFIANSITEEGDFVVSETPIMPDTYGIFQRCGLKILLVERDDDGVNLEQLENLFKKFKPRFFHVMPDYHSITGSRMSLEKRNKLIELARHYDVPILEESWYNGMDFYDSGLPSLFSLDKYKNVVMVDSAFSKFYYGAKTSYILAPEVMAVEIGKHINASQTHLQNLEQLMFAEYLHEGHSEQYRKEITDYYRKKYEHTEHAMRMLRDLNVQWNPLKGGLSIWCRLPGGINDMHLYESLRKQDVLICPGKLFFPTGESPKSYMRLSFSNVADEDIEKGIARIASEIKRNS